MEEACAYALNRLGNGDYVSLGGFGGAIVVGFDHSIANDGDYNFAVKNSVYSNYSEPGIVWVMQDENGNGLPDDTWYELKGSDYSTQTNPEVIKIFGMAAGERAFSYYFVYWLPAALIGKLFGFGAANAALFIWNSIGIFLGFTAMCAVSKRASYAMPFLYVFFAGLDVIPNIVHFFTGYDAWLWLEGWVPGISYVADFTELANVFNQIVPCFLIMALLLMSHNMRSAGLTGGLLFAYSPWAVFGLIPIIIGMAFRKEMRSGSVKTDLKNIFTPVNIVSAIILLVLFGSYYMSNSGAVSFRGFTWTFYDRPELGLPNTNNALEGLFSELKTKVRVHSGISRENRKKLLDELMKRHY